jgi:hypothetical protein
MPLNFYRRSNGFDGRCIGEPSRLVNEHSSRESSQTLGLQFLAIDEDGWRARHTERRSLAVIYSVKAHFSFDFFPA